MKKGLIIFDADGTLFDTHICIYNIWIKIADKLGKELFTSIGHFEEIFSKYHGDWKKYSKYELKLNNEDYKVVWDVWNKYIYSIYDEHCKWYDYIEDNISTLETRGYEIAIATNNEYRLFKKLLINKKFSIHDRIAYENFQKPKPNMIIDHMNNLNFSPKNTYMIGDCLTDLKAARNAGVISIWAKYGSLENKNQLKDFYDYILISPNSLLEIFK